MLFLTTLSTVLKDSMSADGKHHMKASYYHDICISNKIRLLQRMSVNEIIFFFSFDV